MTRVVNCLDLKKSIIDKESDDISKYVFRPERLAAWLFKIPEGGGVDTLCWENSKAGPEDGFKGFVETHRLKGLIFKEIWSGKGK